MPIDPHVAESLAISYGTEEYFGPYELLWGLKTHYPRSTESDRLEAGVAALRSLLERGLIILHTCTTQVPCDSPAPTDLALGMLDAPTFWLTPADHPAPPYFWLSSSPSGERALASGEYSFV